MAHTYALLSNASALRPAQSFGSSRASTRAPRTFVVNAAAKPGWQLDTPGRLWELNETWYPGATAPDYLDASLPGDRGFDPLRLAANPERRPWLVEGELYNGRVAMLAAAGVLLVEAVGKGPWWAAPGKINLPLGYWPTVILVHVAFATFEAKRWSNFQKYGQTGLLGFVPFDPLGLNSDAMRQREVRNGRLAMLANLGFWSQAANTGKGPLANLQDHLADPTHNNICASKVGLEVTIAALAIALSPIVLEARKTLSGKEEEDFRPIPFL